MSIVAFFTFPLRLALGLLGIIFRLSLVLVAVLLLAGAAVAMIRAVT